MKNEKKLSKAEELYYNNDQTDSLLSMKDSEHNKTTEKTQSSIKLPSTSSKIKKP